MEYIVHNIIDKNMISLFVSSYAYTVGSKMTSFTNCRKTLDNIKIKKVNMSRNV